ncbi:MAG: hypothetical protein HY704_04470 [Gemmatimonadetes bacterium]|nr:hypothetical protein [Gemmatimonadota bacterium]
MNTTIREYLAMIGRRGGRISKRKLSPGAARDMVKVREARRAYRRFYAQCFWSCAPELKIRAVDLPWVAEQLRKHGGREAWQVAARLCR